MNSYYGEIAALLTAIFWTVTALSFESASKKIGSLAVNLLRLTFALVLYSGYNFISKGLILPLNAEYHQWFWLSISGIVGFVIGDYFLFKAFIIIGARLSMLIMALVPVLTTVFGWAILGETMTSQELLAMVITVTGIILVVFRRSKDENNIKSKHSLKLSIPIVGLVFAFGGAFGQAGGLILSKYGMQDYDPFLSSQIRIIAGLLCFAIIVAIKNKWSLIGSSLRSWKVLAPLSTGSFFGPFLGVSFSLVAIQNTSTGIASTLMSIVPVLIIIPAWLIFREKISTREIIGAFIAVSGVALFFL